MTDPLLHPKTAERVEAVSKRPPHGLLITGPSGSGKASLANLIAGNILGLSQDSLPNYPYLRVINPDDSTITIESIRELQQFLKLKVPTSDKTKINRVVIVVGAERMKRETQNAVLKTLEEPPADTCIILTAISSEKLLSTIVSRCRELSILPVSLDQAKDYFEQKGIPEARLTSAFALSMGQAGLLSALLKDSDHPLKQKVDQAKSLLGLPAGKRLLQIDAIAKDKLAAEMLLDALRRISHAGLVVASSRGDDKSIRLWHTRETAVLQSIEDLSKNANLKLLLTDLFINL